HQYPPRRRPITPALPPLLPGHRTRPAPPRRRTWPDPATTGSFAQSLLISDSACQANRRDSPENVWNMCVAWQGPLGWVGARILPPAPRPPARRPRRVDWSPRKDTIARAHPCGPRQTDPNLDPTFPGVVLTCTDAEATAAFYRDIADLPLEATGDEDYTYFAADVDGVQIALHGAEAFADYSFPPVAESNLTHLYFRIPDQAE